MDRFNGRLDDLKEIVSRTGYEGDWSEIANGHRFGSRDAAILNWFPGTGKVQFQGPSDAAARLREAVTAAGAGPSIGPRTASAPERPKIFVVHGHDDVAREQLELILHRLELEPFVLARTGGGGMTIIEALEHEVVNPSTRCRFGIVLMTPDDMGYSRRDGPEKADARARQNVVLEMGMLIAALGRANVAILKKGHVDVPADAHGIIYLPFNDHVREAVPKLVDRLRTVGFDLDPGAITRAST